MRRSEGRGDGNTVFDTPDLPDDGQTVLKRKNSYEQQGTIF